MASGLGEDDRSRTRFDRRVLLLGAAQFGAFAAIAARLYQLQIVDGKRYSLLADDNRINSQLLAPLRGRILDRFGRVLASNREVFRLVVVPSLARDLAALLQRLASVVPITEEEQTRLLARARRQPRHLPLIVATDLTFESVAALNVLAPQLPGTMTEITSRREYASASIMSHVVGYTGSHERHAIDDDPILRLPGMKTGKSGVERGMEATLRGIGGSVRSEVDARGHIIRTLERSEPETGRDVAITIDTQLQALALKRLAQERRAAAVALDVEGGEVMMMASQPTFDASEIGNGATGSLATPAGWRRLLTAPHHPMVNRTIQGLYPPGSTFKMVTALAALEAGAVDLKERIDCEGTFSYGGQSFRCWRRKGHGRCDMHRALKESCDCYFYEISRRVGIEAIAAAGERLGFGRALCAGTALEKSGVLPTPRWKLGRLSKPWLGGETILAGIGQGYVSSTPMQLATMAARIATGRAVTPTLIRPEPGRPAPAFAPLAFDSRNLEAVRRAMIAVVNDAGGTGGNASLDDDSVVVAGKTGTSQVTRKSADKSADELRWDERDHALFVGYFPAHAPRYAVAAVVEHAGGGGAAAAPVVRDLMQLLIEHDPLGAVSDPERASGANGRAPARVRG